MSLLGLLGLVVLGAALVVLLVSVLHPEGRRRPGGYLQDDAPQEPHADREEPPG